MRSVIPALLDCAQYAVGAPGDTTAMQRELMAHGPFEVGFEVFSDFGVIISILYQDCLVLSFSS